MVLNSVLVDNILKDSYRIGKILKKITGLKFLSSQQGPKISPAAKQSASAYTQNRKATSNRSIEKPQSVPKEEVKDKYIRYQKEVEAERLLGSNYKPKQPGKILKLPTNREEISFED